MFRKPTIVGLLALMLGACGGGNDNSNDRDTNNGRDNNNSSSVAISSSSASSEAETSSSESSDASSSNSSSEASSSSSSSSVASSENTNESSVSSSSSAASSVSSSSSQPASSSSSAGTAIIDYDFSAEGQLDDWTANTASGATAILSQQDGSLQISPTWTSTGDKFTVHTTTEPFDLSDKTVSVDVKFAEAYTADGNLAMQLYFKDSAGYYANTGYLSTSGNDGEWTTNAASPVSINWSNEEFASNDVTQVGIEFMAGSKAATVGGDIWLDNIFVGAGGETDAGSGNRVVFDFVSGLEGASNNGSPVTLSHDAEAGALVMTPDWTTGENVVAGITLAEPREAIIESVEVVIAIPQVYVDEAKVVVQPYIVRNTAEWTGQWGYYGAGWGYSAGEQTLTWSPEYSEGEFGGVTEVGVQIGGDNAANHPAGDVLIKKIVVRYRE